MENNSKSRIIASRVDEVVYEKLQKILAAKYLTVSNVVYVLLKKLVAGEIKI